jgi:hypothetical protein
MQHFRSLLLSMIRGRDAHIGETASGGTQDPLELRSRFRELA